jgi:hypothetical protein
LEDLFLLMPSRISRISLFFVLLVVILLASPCYAQQRTLPILEYGPLVSWMNMDAESAFDANDLHRGFGVRLTFNVNEFVGVDTDLVHYLGDFNNSRFKAAWNLKLTARGEERARTNVFATIGLGFMRHETVTGSRGQTTASHGPFFSMGGGAEFVPHRRFAFRLGITTSAFRTPSEAISRIGTRWNKEISTSVMIRSKISQRR